MNKLVSKNPVQRFKQGRKIVKAQDGIKTYRGNKVQLGPKGKNYIVWNPKINAYDANIQVTEKDLDTKVGKGNANGKIYKGSDGKWYQNGKIMSNLYSSEIPKENVKSNPYSTKFISTYDDGTWAANANQEGLTNRDQVKAFQRDVLKMGDASDGIWGKNTEAAYQKYLASKQTTPTTSYTPGIEKNNIFTPIRETTTDFNVAKEYLTPKQETPTFNLGTYVGDPTRTYNAGNIRANRGNLYSNVNEYWDYLSNNKNSDDFQLFQNIMGTQDGNLNREAFDAAMAKYGISGNLGRRDSGRLANLLNDLRAIGTEGSDARNAFLNSYKQSFDNVQTGTGNTIYDRSATREWLRNNAGGSAYAFTGDQRKAVRNILNGQGTDQDKELIKGNANLAKALTGYFKIGGTMNILPSRNIVERFKQGRKITFAQNGVSFKDAWNQARANKQRYFNWNGRMYNSKAAGNDTEYESFVDNMNEMSALLPTDRQPKHLGWERNNPTSSEVRGNDREIKKDGTENTLTEIIVSGKKKSKKSKPLAKIVTNKNKNKATRNMSGAWGQGSGGGQQYADQRQYAFERNAFDKMRTSSSSIFGSTAYKTDNRGRRYVERDGSLYYDDGTYYNPQTRKTGKYTYTPGGLFSRNLFTQY